MAPRLPFIFLIGFFSSFSLQAQVTLDASDVPPFGAAFSSATDTLVAGLQPGPAGAGQAWDFSALSGQETVTFLVVDPATTPEGAAFPEATFAFQGTDNFYSYAQVTDVALLALGGSAALPTGGDPVILEYGPAQQVLPVPATFGSTFTNYFGFVLELDGSAINPLIDSVRVVETGNRAAEIDAYGTLTLPNGAYETLRQRVETTTTDSIFVKFFGNWSLFEVAMDTTISYEWWAENGRGTVLALDFDAQGTPLEATYLTDYAEMQLPPVAAFSFELLGNGAVQFNDASENGPTEWLWDFADATISYVQDPLHAYQANGLYTVCLTASNAAGESTVCQDVMIEDVQLPPVAAFSYENSINTGEVLFFDESENEPTAWLWDFGNGSTSTEQNPVAYMPEGVYTVCLTVSNAAGENTFCQDVEAIHNSTTNTGLAAVVKAYPSPTRDLLFLEFGELAGQPVQMQCFNELGQLLSEYRLENAPTGPWAVEVSGLQPGLYRLLVVSNGQGGMAPFVKQ